MNPMSLDPDKFANVVLFFLAKCPNAGVTKLLKLLYLADSQHYRKHLSPLFGGKYVAMERGPVLDNYRQLFGVLERDRVLKERRVKIHGLKQEKVEYTPLQEANLRAFSPIEQQTLHEVVKQFGALDGNKLSEVTHRLGPWSWVWDPLEPNHNIPYTLFRWLDNIELTDPDTELALKSLKRPQAREALKEIEAA
jgi:uncharacterized phage-associated protein